LELPRSGVEPLPPPPVVSGPSYEEEEEDYCEEDDELEGIIGLKITVSLYVKFPF
jgi:hypothetical protein